MTSSTSRPEFKTGSVRSHCDLSIVATVYNDSSNVAQLVQEILTELQKMDITYEIILVNDASVDDSEAAIELLCRNNERIRGISLSRNCGQQIAMSAGIHYASGKHVLIMDGDLQNPPSAIPLLYAKVGEGFDVVYTVSKVRNDAQSEFTSRLLWFTVNKVLRIPMIPNQLMMRIMTAEFAGRFDQYCETNRFIAGITHDIGMQHAILAIENRRRVRGSSNYSALRRLNLSVDLIIGISAAPLNAMLYFGFMVLVVTLLISAYELFVYVTQGSVPGFTSIILSIFFFNGTIIMLLGLLGKYLANIYTEVRRRPLYYVRNKFNL